MAQQLHAADVHPDELCPPNKRYDLMDANKKVDLEHVQCPPESKILTNFIKNHSLRFSIAASSSVPWIYMAQFWHTLKEDGSKYRLKFMLDRKELILTLDDFRTIFHLPQATDNNHNSFVPPPSFSDMVPFYKQRLRFTMELKTSSSFKTSGLLRARDIYHNLQEDDIMKNIFNSGRNKNKVGMRIPAWMITEEMKQTEHYQMYAEVSGLDVPLTQSQPTESTQGTHRTTSASRRSTRLTPPAQDTLQDTLQVSLAEHKSCEEQEARENMALVNEHLATAEIDKLVDDSENVVDDSSPPRNDDTTIHGTRLEPRSDKESPEVETTKEKEVEITKETEVEFVAKTVELTSDKASPEVEITKENEEDITNIVPPMNVDDEEDEITDEVYELKRREKRKDVEESRNSPIPTPTRSPRIFSNLVSSDTEKLQELTVTHTTPSSSSHHTKLTKTNHLLSLLKTKPTRFKRYKSLFHELQERYGYLFTHLRERFVPRKSSDQLADDLHDVMAEMLSSMVKDHVTEQVKKQVPEQVRDQVPVLKFPYKFRKQLTIAFLLKLMRLSEVISMKADPQMQQQDIAIWLALQIKFERTQVPQTACRPSAIHPRDQEDPHDDAHPEGENSAKRQKTSEYEAYVFGESSSGQVNEEEPGLSTLIPTKQVSQDIMEEISLRIDEAKLKKMADEMLRQRCTSGDEHQYHIDQMKNFLQSDIVWESRKEILDSPHPRKATPLVLSCQINPNAPVLSLINQDLLYLKKGNSGPEKIVLSLHKFLAVIFNDNDIEERTSRWVNKCVKKFNPYARYGVERWKNRHAKIFYIRKQKEPGRPKEEIYSNSKIVQPDYKNLNKNDIEDIYLLIMNSKVPDYADTGLLCYQQKVNLTAPTMTFPGIEEYDVFSIVYEPVHGIIYKNSKKEKRVMRHYEIHKFCDATLIRVLEGLKSYNNDVKYVYVQKELTSDEVEYLKLFEEEIEVRLKYRNQIRRWEIVILVLGSSCSFSEEFFFVALAAAGSEAEWLRNLVYEIPLWPKPMPTISVRCDSVATLAKDYSQVYNGKSRHLGVRQNMIHELIMNDVISVEFVKTQLNLADHLTKGLTRDLTEAKEEAECEIAYVENDEKKNTQDITIPPKRHLVLAPCNPVSDDSGFCFVDVGGWMPLSADDFLAVLEACLSSFTFYGAVPVAVTEKLHLWLWCSNSPVVVQIHVPPYVWLVDVAAWKLCKADLDVLVGAKRTSTWDDNEEHLYISFDGTPLSLDGANWKYRNSSLVITRTSSTNGVAIEVQDIFKITAAVVRVGAEESRIHDYNITNDDCFAHLELGFKFFSLSDQVDGVLGQTYRSNYVSKIKVSANMPVMGGRLKYSTSGIFASDCTVSRFARVNGLQ
ncbi:retrovirus-related pol polyprotein from transposon TNT 1-94 [Tanacetum coccineum]